MANSACAQNMFNALKHDSMCFLLCTRFAVHAFCKSFIDGGRIGVSAKSLLIFSLFEISIETTPPD